MKLKTRPLQGLYYLHFLITMLAKTKKNPNKTNAALVLERERGGSFG